MKLFSAAVFLLLLVSTFTAFAVTVTTLRDSGRCASRLWFIPMFWSLRVVVI
jgi:hypothetical protein